MKALLSLLISLGITSVVSVVSAQETTTVITVNDPRPLSEAILKLEKVSNQPMTYEDAPMVYAGDLVDMSNVYRHKPGVKVLMPKSEPLSLTVTMTEIADRAGTAQVLGRLVTKFNREHPEGPQFTILDKDGLFHVIPTSQRLASGKVPGKGILDDLSGGTSAVSAISFNNFLAVSGVTCTSIPLLYGFGIELRQSSLHAKVFSSMARALTSCHNQNLGWKTQSVHAGVTLKGLDCLGSQLAAFFCGKRLEFFPKLVRHVAS